MASATLTPVLRHLHRLVARPGADGLTDRQLLEQFATHRDEAAFAVLVRRHGPLVLGVARRRLPCEQDAEDVFQATFLVLACKAGSVRWRESVGGWLYEVAQRIARKAQADALRRRGHERQAATMRRTQSLPEVPDGDLRGVLDEEIRRLPEVYRAPVVLCYLEGKSHTEAAAQLGWPEGTVKGRLARARDRLRGRLARRGVTLSAGAVAAALARQEALAAVPTAAASSTARAAALFAAGPVAVGGGITAQVAALAEGALRGLVGAKHTLLALLLAVGLSVAGSSVLVHWALAGPPAANPEGRPMAVAREATPPAPAKDQPRTDRYGDPLPPGALARLGTTRFRHGFILYRVAYAPDGKTVASAGADRGVCLWDVATGKEVHPLRPGRHCYGLAFSPDGKLLAGSDTRIHLWDTATGKEVRQLPGHQGGATMVLAYSPDGRTLASGGHDRLVRLWEIATGKEVRQLEGHQAVVSALAFSPAGKTLASAGLDKTIRLWEPATGQTRGVLAGHKGHIPGLAFAPDGKLLASGSEDQTLRLWEPTTGKEVRVLDGQHGAVEAVAFSPDSRTLVSGHADNHLRLWDVESGKLLRAWEAHAFRVTTVAFAPDGRTLASGASWDSGPRFWDVATGRERYPFTGHRGPLVHLEFSADGRVLYSTARDKTVRRWDLARGGDEAVPFRWHWPGLTPSALSPDRKTLATADTRDHAVRLWDGSPGQEARLLGKHTAMVRALAFSPDGTLLASGGLDRIIHLWDVAGGRERAQLKGHEDQVISLVFSPDGKTLASGARPQKGPKGGRTLRLWDVATGKETRPFEHQEEVFCLAFSPDGKQLATVDSWMGRVCLWEVATGKELRPLNVSVGGYYVAFSPDGRLLAWGGDERDNTVRVFEAATGQEVRRYDTGRAGCFALAFSPDGRAVASGGGDSTILLWDVTGRQTDGRTRAVQLSPPELEARWVGLADVNTGRAYEAVWDLVAAPRQAVPFLAGRLRPAEAADPQRVAGLIADLDDKRFAVRKKAMQELERLGELAGSALRKTLENPSSLEVRQRAEQLLAKLDWAASPGQLRLLRALTVLETVATPEAWQVLQTLAGGMPEARLTQEAKAAVERLSRRTTGPR